MERKKILIGILLVSCISSSLCAALEYEIAHPVMGEKKFNVLRLPGPGLSYLLAARDALENAGENLQIKRDAGEEQAKTGPPAPVQQEKEASEKTPVPKRGSLKPFVPSEEIPAGQAVDFPADI